MKQEEILINNWNKLIDLIKNTFSGDRQLSMLKMYEYFKDRMMFTPASSHDYFHNCFPGGYVDHVLNIVQYAREIKDLWYKRISLILKSLIFNVSIILTISFEVINLLF